MNGSRAHTAPSLVLPDQNVHKYISNICWSDLYFTRHPINTIIFRNGSMYQVGTFLCMMPYIYNAHCNIWRQTFDHALFWALSGPPAQASQSNWRECHRLLTTGTVCWWCQGPWSTSAYCTRMAARVHRSHVTQCKYFLMGTQNQICPNRGSGWLKRV